MDGDNKKSANAAYIIIHNKNNNNGNKKFLEVFDIGWKAKTKQKVIIFFKDVFATIRFFQAYWGTIIQFLGRSEAIV